ncbi:MAG: 5'/3'-nucleotidase SurE [Dehalococcoidales bacterium]|nr:5'/3'-nucleotidase SurE [Dehalococcoidales bacterium]
MNILVTNDDGINAESLWALVRELQIIARVTVVAPDGERSAIGTAVTLFEPLHAEKVRSPVPGVTAYAVDGSPSDCVILALGKLVEDSVDIVVSGINTNLNLGEDVHISGTVGGALQGYFHGLPALAVSAPPDSQPGLDSAARVTAILAQKIAAKPTRIFLNINVPDLPLEEIGGLKITRLARSSHINTVEEDDHGQKKQYRLVRERLTEAGEDGTDILAIEQGDISITPLYTSLLDKPPQRLLKRLCAELTQLLLKG